MAGGTILFSQEAPCEASIQAGSLNCCELLHILTVQSLLLFDSSANTMSSVVIVAGTLRECLRGGRAGPHLLPCPAARFRHPPARPSTARCGSEARCRAAGPLRP